MSELVENLYTKEHKVIVMIRREDCVMTYKAYNVEQFLEMSEKEKDYKIELGWIYGKKINTSQFKTFLQIRQYLTPVTELKGQISLFDLIK